MPETSTAPPFPLASVPPAPRRPSPRASKLVLRLTTVDWVLLLIGSILLMVGVLAVLSSAESVASDFTLLAEGRETKGRVVSLSEDTSRRHKGGDHPWIIRIAYDVDGRTYETESTTFNDAIVSASQVGSEVGIEYAPRNPVWARVSGTTRNESGYAAVLVLLFPLVGGLFLFLTFRKSQRRRRAFTFGRAVTAEVVKFGFDHTTKVNGQPQFEMTWRYTVGGQTFDGRLEASDQGKLADFENAKTIVILVEEDVPQVSAVWVP